MNGFGRTAWILAGFLVVGAAQAQPGPKVEATSAAGVPALLLSDLHFDPFRDPGKVARLVAAPISGWDAILEEPNSPTQATTLAAEQAACGGKGLDADHALLVAGLNAAKLNAAGVKFVTISGDLLVHQFDCRFENTAKSADYAAFAEKTASYVVHRVETEFAGAAVYVAMGNNDSSCGDYKLDPHDRFFAGTSDAVIAGLRGASVEETRQAREDYLAGGYFAVTLPAPMEHARLLVFDDMYLSRKYATCAGKQDSTGENNLMAWLARELDAARTRGEKVWVMGHIPVGIDVFSTLKKGDVCANEPDEFMTARATVAMANLLGSHADVLRLVIFGHTHMDEMRLLPTTGAGAPGAIPVKGVASISPVNGNRPSVTVARVDAATAVMTDYGVYMAPNRTGAGVWTREYDYRETYLARNFSGASVRELVTGFERDPGGAAAASQAYEINFDPGFPIPPLIIAWPQYACGIDHPTAAGFKACACAAVTP